jgi:hypothetical protein
MLCRPRHNRRRKRQRRWRNPRRPHRLQEYKQTALTTPIEPDAVIYPGAQQSVSLLELVHYVRASGFRCDSISALQPLPSSHGYRLVCNRFSFKYAIEDKDNRLTVAVE